jgi:hypothetical protein
MNNCKIILSFIFSILYFQAIAQYGSKIEGAIYLKNKKKPLEGELQINRKGQKVFLKAQNKDNEKIISIEEIDSIKTGNTQLYIVKNYDGVPTLFKMNVKGHISLVDNEQLGVYFFLKGDTLHKIDKEKIRGYLNLFLPNFSYTDRILDISYQKIRYNDPFLIPVVETYNREKFPNEKNTTYFLPKTKLSISPFIAMSYNLVQITFLDKKYSYVNSFQPNYGVSVTLSKNDRISYGLELYRSKFQGRTTLAPIEKSLPDELLGYSIGTYSFDNLFLDLKIQYDFTKKGRKINAFLFGGSSIGIPLDKKFQIYQTQVEITDFLYHSSAVAEATKDNISSFALVGGNIGGGITYRLSDKNSLRLYTKVQYTAAYVGNSLLSNTKKIYEGFSINNEAISLGLSFTRSF